MWRIQPSPYDGQATPVELFDNAIEFVRKVGISSQRAAIFGTAFISLASAAIPLCLIASEHYLPFFLGKLLPSMLAVLATVGTAWMTFSRPFEKWRLFRKIEFAASLERAKYAAEVYPYDGPDRDAALLAYLEMAQRSLLDGWSNLLPSTSEAVQPALREGYRPPPPPPAS